MGLIVAAVTAIAGVVSSAGAAVTTFAGTALGGLVVKAVAYVGLNLLSGLLAKRQGDDEPTGVQLNLQLGADEYRSVTFGEVARAGHLTFFNSYGDNRKYLQLVFDLSSSHCQGLNSVIVDGQEKSLTSIATVSNEDARYHVADFSDKIKIAFYSGANGQGINQELVDNSGGRWSSTDKKTGVCYVYVLLEWDDDYFERRPEFIFVFNGTLCYDWRKDSTNGGSGSHRVRASCSVAVSLIRAVNIRSRMSDLK